MRLYGNRWVLIRRPRIHCINGPAMNDPEFYKRRMLCVPLKPTSEQEAILTAVRTCNTSIMIKAYAGVAKTTTLVMLSKELPILPNFTLALAFNKQTSVELKSLMPKHITVFTLNAVGKRAWQRKLGMKITLSVENDKISTLTEEVIREFSTRVAAPGSNASRAALLADNILPRGFMDLAPPERAELLTLISAARKCRLIPSHFIDTGSIPDTPSSWAKLAADCSVPAPGPEMIHLARQMLIDRAAIPPGSLVPGPESELLQAEVVSLVISARIKGLVPSYFTAHKGLVTDAEGGWAELALGCGMLKPDTWKKALARKVLVRSILAAYAGRLDFDDQVYCSALLGGHYLPYKVR